MCTTSMQIGSILIFLSLFSDGNTTTTRSTFNASLVTGQWRVTIKSIAGKFVQRIFEEYADDRTGKISIEKFEDFLEALDLSNGSSSTKHSEEHVHDKNHKKRSIDRMQRGKRESIRKNRQIRADEERDDHATHEKCVSPVELLAIHGMNSSEGVSQDDFVNLCPSLIYQIEGNSCQAAKHEEGEPHGNEEEQGQQAEKWKVWTFGVVAITVISLSSLCAIAVIPLMGRASYTRVMSLLIALAVGTLSGDALLHLIPHAFVPAESHDHSSAAGASPSERPVFKACVVMFAIYGFFLLECIMKVRAAKKNAPARLRAHACGNVKLIKKHGGKQEKYDHHVIGSRLAGLQRCRSCDFPAKSRAPGHTAHAVCSETAFLEREERGHEEKELTPVSSWDSRENCFHVSAVPKVAQFSFSDSALCGAGCDPRSTRLGKSNDDYRFSEISQTHGDHVHCEYEHSELSSDGNKDSDEHVDDHVHVHVHSSSHALGHSHAHGHSHNIDKNTSIATVAWMVIVGDGFHNFGDGLAVGAAFAASLGTGLTTAIAVFCHELPHELGDFAILVRSGFTIKQAMTYNMVSALIAYIGLILGIFIGDVSSAQGWVLSLTAGMFLYISLVDMLPELNNYISEGGWGAFVCQNVGFLTGTAIMLVIAVYESH